MREKVKAQSGHFLMMSGHSMKKSNWFLLAMFLCFSQACSEPPTPEEAFQAGRCALEFCQITFSQKKMTAGYALLSPNTKRDISQADFEEIMKQLHPDGFPTKFKAVEYEKLEGKSMMDIYLIAERGNKKFYYRVTLKGTPDTGYSVNEVYRSIDVIPSFGSRHKIQPPLH